MKSRLLPSFLFFSLLGIIETKAQFSVFAGPQVTTAKYTIRDVKQNTEQKQGFMAGVAYQTLIEGPVYFSPMISFTRKGYKVSFDRPAFPPDSAALNNDVSVNAIELAPLLQINLSKKENYLFLRVGPAFDFNISGKEQFDTSGNKPVKRNMVFSFGDYSHATISMNGQLGFQHKKGLTIFAHYSYGLSSLNNADFGPSIFHRSAGICLGWRFGSRN